MCQSLYSFTKLIYPFIEARFYFEWEEYHYIGQNHEIFVTRIPSNCVNILSNLFYEI